LVSSEKAITAGDNRFGMLPKHGACTVANKTYRAPNPKTGRLLPGICSGPLGPVRAAGEFMDLAGFPLADPLHREECRLVRIDHGLDRAEGTKK
jgi:hypothetical protein